MWVGFIQSIEDLKGTRLRSPKEEGSLPLDSSCNISSPLHLSLRSCPAVLGLASPHDCILNLSQSFFLSHSHSLNMDVCVCPMDSVSLENSNATI